MTQKEVLKLIDLLKIKGVKFEKGLNEKEFSEIEKKFNLKFPPDLRLFLKNGLPVSWSLKKKILEHRLSSSKSFIDWRAALKSTEIELTIRSRLEWPLEGMLYDIVNNGFWIEEWGVSPENLENKKRIAQENFKNYPKLIPLFSHRYIPQEPSENDNPVFSVYQMDIIYYGYNLAQYFANEFHFELPTEFATLKKPKEIRFWSETERLNG